jgi:hypothetical protein
VRFRSIELEILFCSALKVQRWWKGVLLLKLRAKSAVIIQSHIRAWFARRNAAREKHLIVFIQVRYSSFVHALLYLTSMVILDNTSRVLHWPGMIFWLVLFQ